MYLYQKYSQERGKERFSCIHVHVHVVRSLVYSGFIQKLTRVFAVLLVNITVVNLPGIHN